MAKQNMQPVNVFNKKIFFWVSGNNAAANSNVDENFEIIDRNLYPTKKILTFTDWRDDNQARGYTFFGYKVNDERQLLLVMPDGSVPRNPFPEMPYVVNEGKCEYANSIFTPLTKQEMEIVKSKLLLPINYKNIVESRDHIGYDFFSYCCAYFVDSATNIMIDWQLDCNDYDQQEDAYILPILRRGLDAIFNKNLRPATKEELAAIIDKANKQDDETVKFAKQNDCILPNKMHNVCLVMRQEYLDSLNNPPTMGDNK